MSFTVPLPPAHSFITGSSLSRDTLLSTVGTTLGGAIIAYIQTDSIHTHPDVLTASQTVLIGLSIPSTQLRLSPRRYQTSSMVYLFRSEIHVLKSS